MKKIFLFITLLVLSFSSVLAVSDEEQKAGDKVCNNTFWGNSHWTWDIDGKWLYLCNCNTWYEFDSSGKKCIKAGNIENGNLACQKLYWPLSYWDWKDYSATGEYMCSCLTWAAWSKDWKSCVKVDTEKITDWNLNLAENTLLDNSLKETMWILHDYLDSFDKTRRDRMLNSLISNVKAKNKDNLITSDKIILTKITNSLINLKNNWDKY